MATAMSSEAMLTVCLLFHMLVCQDLLALPRAGRGPDFPDHLIFSRLLKQNGFHSLQHLFFGISSQDFHRHRQA